MKNWAKQLRVVFFRYWFPFELPSFPEVSSLLSQLSFFSWFSSPRNLLRAFSRSQVIIVIIINAFFFFQNQHLIPNLMPALCVTPYSCPTPAEITLIILVPKASQLKAGPPPPPPPWGYFSHLWSLSLNFFFVWKLLEKNEKWHHFCAHAQW